MLFRVRIHVSLLLRTRQRLLLGNPHLRQNLLYALPLFS